MIKHTPKQEDALRVLGSDARHILLRGGARCVAGDTVLDGHSRTIAELARDGLPVIVRTSWGEQLAEAPFLKGWAELYRVCLSDGREVTVTSDHRFWTDRGWQPLSALGVGALLAASPHECDASRPLSTLASGLRSSPAGAPRSSETPEDWPGRCSSRPRRCDAPLRSEAAGGQGDRASRRDAQAHSHWDRIGGQCESDSRADHREAREPADTLACRLSPRPSTTGGGPKPEAHAGWPAPAFWQTSEPSPGLPQTHLRSEARSIHPRSFAEACRGSGSLCDQFSGLALTCDVPFPAGFQWASIVSITRTAVQPYYTLHVPGCEHYFANGVLHHNSGKTVILMEAVLTRALAAPGSRHAVLRYRANSLKSITGPTGTLYYVLDNCFPPEVRERGRYHAQDDYYQLLNGSEVWFGGLDDPKRVDKILGWEFNSLYFNEVSQIPWGSYTTAMTRLAQTSKLTGGGTLRQKAYLDCNPPPETHWVNRLFIEKRDPDTKRPLADPAAYATVLINPEDNRENLDPAFLESLRNLPERQRKRFYLGQFGDAGEAALWTSELLDQQRILDVSKLPEFVRIVVAIDPSGADDIEDTGADEIGIVVAGLGENGAAYILEDLTMRGSPGEWGAAATAAYDRHGANTIVGESNFGGAMVRHVIQTAKPGVPYKEVTASRGKHIRAEPVSALFESRKVWMVGRFPELEDEMTAMTTAGYTGTKSPNRLDAMVWAVSELFPGIIRQAKREDGGLARPMVPKVNLGHSASKRYREARRW